MPISIHQLAVALPFTLVSSLGIGLMVQNYGFESTDLIAAQPAGTPAQLNAVQGPEEPVEQRRDASGQPSGLKELLNRTAPPAAQPGISDLAAPSAPAAAVPAPTPRLTERTNPSSKPSTNPSTKPSVKPSNKSRTNAAAARVGKPKTVNLSPLVVPACVPTRTDGRSKSKPDLPVGVVAPPGMPNLGIPRGRSVAAKPTIGDPAGAKPKIGDPAGVKPGGLPAGVKPGGLPAGVKPGDPQSGVKPGELQPGVKPGELQPGVKPGERPAGIKPNPAKPTDAVPGDPKSTARIPDGAAPNSALPAPAPRREIHAVPPGLVDRVGAAPGAGMPAKGSISSDGRIPDLRPVPNAVPDPKSSKGVKPSDQAPGDSRSATDPSLPSAADPSAADPSAANPSAANPSATDPSDAGAPVPGAVDPSDTEPESGSVEGVEMFGQLEGKPACVESMPLTGASRPGAGESGHAPVPGRKN